MRHYTLSRDYDDSVGIERFNQTVEPEDEFQLFWYRVDEDVVFYRLETDQIGMVSVPDVFDRDTTGAYLMNAVGSGAFTPLSMDRSIPRGSFSAYERSRIRNRTIWAQLLRDTVIRKDRAMRDDYERIMCAEARMAREQG